MRRISPEQSGTSEAILEGRILMTSDPQKAAEVLRPLALRHPAYGRLLKLAARRLIEIGAITTKEELTEAVRSAILRKGYE